MAVLCFSAPIAFLATQLTVPAFGYFQPPPANASQPAGLAQRYVSAAAPATSVDRDDFVIVMPLPEPERVLSTTTTQAAILPVSSGSAQAVAAQMATARGWGDDQFECLVSLWAKESGWRVTATNSGSGAYGIPQAYPGSKMASAGADWRTSAATQITWGLGYIAARYGTPCAAWAHSEAVNSY